MNKRIIGLCGTAGTGKSTVAQLLNGEVISFAKPLKDMLRSLGLTTEQLYGAEKMTPTPLLGGKTPREAMQTLGTEWGRELMYPNIWVDAWKRSVEASPSRLVICDDVRFTNEVNLIHSMGGYIIGLTRAAAAGAGNHASESLGLSSASTIIANDGTIEDLRRTLAGLLGKDSLR